MGLCDETTSDDVRISRRLLRLRSARRTLRAPRWLRRRRAPLRCCRRCRRVRSRRPGAQFCGLEAGVDRGMLVMSAVFGTAPGLFRRESEYTEAGCLTGVIDAAFEMATVLTHRHPNSHPRLSQRTPPNTAHRPVGSGFSPALTLGVQNARTGRSPRRRTERARSAAHQRALGTRRVLALLG